MHGQWHDIPLFTSQAKIIRYPRPAADFEPHLSWASRANLCVMTFWMPFFLNITERTFFFTDGEKYIGMGPYAAAPGGLGGGAVRV